MPSRRFDIRDFNRAAEEIVSLHDSRKQKRAEKELEWNEVDRQIRMEPDKSHKMLPRPDGSPSDRPDPKKAWMPAFSKVNAHNFHWLSGE